MTNGFRKSCNPESRKFFEDFDLLPVEIKQMLWDQPRGPTPEDLKAAWELVEQDKSISGIDRIIQNLNCFAERRKEEKKKRREEAKRQAELERSSKWMNRFNRRRVEIMVRVDPRKRQDKHGNLVRMVMSEQELASAMSKRTEAKDIKLAEPYWERRFVEPKELKDKELNFLENEPKDSVIKALHNA